MKYQSQIDYKSLPVTATIDLLEVRGEAYNDVSDVENPVEMLKLTIKVGIYADSDKQYLLECDTISADLVYNNDITLSMVELFNIIKAKYPQIV